MTIHWKVLENTFIVVLFLVQFYPVWNLGKLNNFELATITNERFKAGIDKVVLILYVLFISAQGRPGELFSHCSVALYIWYTFSR